MLPHSNYCQLTGHKKGDRCTVCGWVLPLDMKPPVLRNCSAVTNTESKQPKPQLGDRLESLLKKVGITEEKYRELKSMAGFSPTCNCPQRHRFLNKLPAALALGYARGGICGAYQSALQLAQENKEYFSKPR